MYTFSYIFIHVWLTKFLFSSTSCSERRDLEANVESVEKMRCFRKRSMFPFLGFLITFLLFFNLYMDDGYVLVRCVIFERLILGYHTLWWCSTTLGIFLVPSCVLIFWILGGWKKTAGRDIDASCKLWKIRTHIQRSIQFLWDYQCDVSVPCRNSFAT